MNMAKRREIRNSTAEFLIFRAEVKEHAETEFEKYRILQDRLFQSDFDKFLGELPFIDETDTK